MRQSNAKYRDKHCNADRRDCKMNSTHIPRPNHRITSLARQTTFFLWHSLILFLNLILILSTDVQRSFSSVHHPHKAEVTCVYESAERHRSYDLPRLFEHTSALVFPRVAGFGDGRAPAGHLDCTLQTPTATELLPPRIAAPCLPAPDAVAAPSHPAGLLAVAKFPRSMTHTCHAPMKFRSSQSGSRPSR